MRRLRLPALVLGAASLVLGVGTGLAVTPVAQDREQALSAALDHAAVTSDDFLERASSVVLLAAQSPAFSDVYANVLPGATLTRDEVPAATLAETSTALVRVERLFHGQVAKVCLIDLSGAELSCVADGHEVAATDLTRRPAAAASLVLTAVPVNAVYAGLLSTTPDTREPVVPLSTLVPDVTSTPRAILEFDVTLTALSQTIAATPAQTAQLVDADSGLVLVDDVRTHPTATYDSPAPRRYDVSTWQSSGRLRADGRAIAYERLSHHTSTGVNTNAWAVVVTGQELPYGWSTGLDVGPLGLTLLGVVLLALAAAGFVQQGRELVRRSLVDELTDLPNRQSLYNRLQGSLNGRGDICAVMIIDLDRFKTVNDTLGHTAGDQLLAEVGRRFAALCPPGDLVARLGGDEFGYLVGPPDAGDSDGSDGVDTSRVVDQARRLVHALETPVVIDGSPVQAGCSIGVALVGEHGADVSSLVRRADLAMYETKRRHTGVTVFDARLERRNSADLTFETSLLLAMERHELVLHYQPQIDISSGEVSGVEALVRWQHPQLGLLYPDKFIPAAEETGLIVGLTKHVLAMALDQVLLWSNAGTQIPVAVNLAARNVADPRLPSDVALLLAERGLDPAMLRLELTETDLLGDPDQARAVLEELRGLGVELAVDDFGTGFASLSQLRHLPFKELKIDRSFVAVLEADPQAVHIVDSIVDLAHGLGLTVTAEGVETEACLDVLRSVGCDIAQGYLFSRPLPPQALLDWVLLHDPLTVVRHQPAVFPQRTPSAL
jgi:diguanylate cyclase (GGDEF)-like protein